MQKHGREVQYHNYNKGKWKPKQFQWPDLFFASKEELYYMIAGYINTLHALWITK
jgi:hypothetical protein